MTSLSDSAFDQHFARLRKRFNPRMPDDCTPAEFAQTFHEALLVLCFTDQMLHEASNLALAHCVRMPQPADLQRLLREHEHRPTASAAQHDTPRVEPEPWASLRARASDACSRCFGQGWIAERSYRNGEKWIGRTEAGLYCYRCSCSPPLPWEPGVQSDLQYAEERADRNCNACKGVGYGIFGARGKWARALGWHVPPEGWRCVGSTPRGFTAYVCPCVDRPRDDTPPNVDVEVVA